MQLQRNRQSGGQLLLGSSRLHSIRSPGWQLSSRQSASSVEKRMARALFVFRIERLAIVKPILSASSVSVMLLSSSRWSSFIRIGMTRSLDGERLFFVESRSCSEDLCDSHQDKTADDYDEIEVGAYFQLQTLDDEMCGGIMHTGEHQQRPCRFTDD